MKLKTFLTALVATVLIAGGSGLRAYETIQNAHTIPPYGFSLWNSAYYNNAHNAIAASGATTAQKNDAYTVLNALGLYSQSPSNYPGYDEEASGGASGYIDTDFDGYVYYLTLVVDW